jgi:hypothetical protein
MEALGYFFHADARCCIEHFGTDDVVRPPATMAGPVEREQREYRLHGERPKRRRGVDARGARAAPIVVRLEQHVIPAVVLEHLEGTEQAPKLSVDADTSLANDVDIRVLCGVPTYDDYISLVRVVEQHVADFRWPHHGDIHEGFRVGLAFLRLPNSPAELATLLHAGSDRRVLMMSLFVAETLDTLACDDKVDGAIFCPVTDDERDALLGPGVQFSDGNGLSLAFDTSYWFTQHCHKSRELRYRLRDKKFKKRDYVKLAIGCLRNNYMVVADAPFAAASKGEDYLILQYLLVVNPNLLEFALEVGGDWALDRAFHGVVLPDTVVAHIPPKRVRRSSSAWHSTMLWRKEARRVVVGLSSAVTRSFSSSDDCRWCCDGR